MANNTRRRRKMNLPMVLAVVLFYLTVFSTYLTAGLYAKYTVAGSSSDSARVIKFGEITLTETRGVDPEKQTGGGNWMITPGSDNDLQMQVTVDFDGSEADTYVYLAVHTPGWTKATNNVDYLITNEGVELMKWSMDQTKDATTKELWWTYLLTEKDAQGNETHVYYKYLDSNKQLDAINVVKDNKITVNDTLKKSDLLKINGIKLNFTAYVRQANGRNWSDIVAGWNSFKN